MIVFFTQTWERRAHRASESATAPGGMALRPRYDTLRWLGLALALAGVAAMSS